MVDPLISVIIPTYNRAEILRLALDSLAAQTLSPAAFEVLVVDNNSQDHTRAVVEEFCQRQSHFHYVHEHVQGAAHARNRGLQHARGEYVGLMDDDAKASSTWLAEAVRIIREQHPQVFGGPFFPFYISKKPAWFKSDYGGYALTEAPRPMAANEYVYGGNMFIHRATLQAVGGFPVDRGPVGKVMAFGEEIVPQQKIRKAYPNSVFFYDPRLVTYNLVRPEQMSVKRVWRDAFARGQTAFFLFRRGRDTPLSPAKYWRSSAMLWGEFAADVLRGLLTRDRAQFPCVQNYWVEHTREIVMKLGRARARRNAWLGDSNGRAERETHEH